MSTTHLRYPTALPGLHRIAERDAAESAPKTSRRGVFATLKDWFQGYDGYFAEMEQSLPPAARQARREQRDDHRLIAMALMAR